MATLVVSPWKPCGASEFEINTFGTPLAMSLSRRRMLCSIGTKRS